MIKYYEKIIATLSTENIEILLDLCRRGLDRRDLITEMALGALLSAGFEIVDVENKAFLTKDGREVVWAGLTPVALKMEEHIKRKEFELGAMRGVEKSHTAIPAAKPGEAMTSVLCPACFCIMGKTVLCQSCAKSKEGFKILCTCSDCGHEVYL